MQECTVELFPKNSDEALAFLYVQKQDLTGMTPTQVHDMYQNACFEIRKDRLNKRKAGWFSKMKESSAQG